jgi:hypothetical protein
MTRVEIERTRVVAAPPAAIWQRCYADPRSWPLWNRELVSAELRGPFVTGTIARVRFRTGLRLRFRLTEVEPERVFTDEARLPFARMGHRHSLEPSGQQTVLRNTIYFHGPLAQLWARLGSARAAAALEEGQQRIAEMAEEDDAPANRAATS